LVVFKRFHVVASVPYTHAFKLRELLLIFFEFCFRSAARRVRI